MPQRAAAARRRAPQDRAVHQRAREGRHLGRRPRQHLQDPAVAARAGPRPDRGRAPAPGKAEPRPTCPSGKPWSTPASIRSTRSPSPWSASTSTTRTPTSRWPRRSSTAACASARKVKLKWLESERGREATARDAAARRRRHPGAGRLRRPRLRGQGAHRASTRARHGVPYFGICYGMQAAVVDVRAPRGRPGRRQQHRERPASRASGDRPDHRMAHRQRRRRAPQTKTVRPRRHHAPGPAGAAHQARHAGARDVRQGRRRRAPPPSLRVQQPLPHAARGRRPGHLRQVDGRPAGRDGRAAATRTRGSSPARRIRSSCRRRATAIRCSSASSAPRASTRRRRRTRCCKEASA